MIIVEGPDNSGKSTLCQKLAAYFNVPIIHSGGPAVNNSEIIERTDKMLNSEEVCIRDRFPLISDYVYGTILRNGDTAFKLDVFYEYKRLLLKRHPVIILAWPPINRMLNIHGHVPKAHETQDHVDQVVMNQEKIIQLYHTFFLNMPHYKYNFYEHNTDWPIIRGAVKKQLQNMGAL